MAGNRRSARRSNIDSSGLTRETSVTNTQPEADDIITLQVNDQRFVITAGVLCERSAYFNALLMGKVSTHPPPQCTADGAYIVQANPVIFQQILDFCLTSMYPLLMDGSKIAFGKYAQLLQQAQYFGVDSLVQWIKRQGYNDVVQTELESSNQNYLRSMYDVVTQTVSPDTGIEHHFVKDSGGIQVLMVRRTITIDHDKLICGE